MRTSEEEVYMRGHCSARGLTRVYVWDTGTAVGITVICLNSLLSGCPPYLLTTLQKLRNTGIAVYGLLPLSSLSGCPLCLVCRLHKVQNSGARALRSDYGLYL